MLFSATGHHWFRALRPLKAAESDDSKSFSGYTGELHFLKVPPDRLPSWVPPERDLPPRVEKMIIRWWSLERRMLQRTWVENAAMDDGSLGTFYLIIDEEKCDC
jgi:hypothetical protein